MAVKPIPEGYGTLTPYLVVKGAGGLIEFLKEAFDAVELFRMARPDGTIGHAEVKIGDSRLMIGEGSEQWPPRPGMFYLYTTDADAAYRRALAAGATSVREPADQFYGDCSGGVQDAFGNQWWVATHVEDVPPDELDRRAAAHATATA
jgi:PhnB protein